MILRVRAYSYEILIEILSNSQKDKVASVVRLLFAGCSLRDFLNLVHFSLLEPLFARVGLCIFQLYTRICYILFRDPYRNRKKKIRKTGLKQHDSKKRKKSPIKKLGSMKKTAERQNGMFISFVLA